MKAPGLPADQQFFADLFSGLVLNPQLLGRVWFASQPASLPVGSLCIDFPRLDIVLRGEYGNLLEAKQQRLVEGEMLFIPARAANLPINNKPVMLLSLVFAPTWLGLSFYDSRTTSLLHPARQIQLPSLQRGEGEAILTALTHLSRFAAGAEYHSATGVKFAASLPQRGEYATGQFAAARRFSLSQHL